MLKGVNKQIIEIKCTNNEYFEKILLFVNPQSCNHSDENINLRAKMYAQNFLDEQNGFAAEKPRRKISFRVSKIALLIAGLVVAQALIVLTAYLLV